MNILNKLFKLKPKNMSTIAGEGKRVVIIGGVAAGASAATRLRRVDETANIQVIERGPYVSFANCGLPYYVGDVIHDEAALLVAKPELFRDRFGIQVSLNTEAVSIDKNAKKVLCMQEGNKVQFPYDSLVLATGSVPVKPNIPGINDIEHLFTVHDIPDARQIRQWIDTKNAKRAVVIGGGFVGLETAENLRHQNLSVELIEALPQVLGPVDRDIAERVHQVLRENDVTLHLSDKVVAFEKGSDGGSVVVTESGSRLSADLVIMSIGTRTAARELVQSAGLKMGEHGGIVVDEHMRTSVPDIFAAGDAVETLDFVTGETMIHPLAGPANRQGRIVADVIAGTLPNRFRGSQGTAVCGLFGLTVAMTGASQRALERANIAHEYVCVHPSNHAGYYPNAAQLHLKLLFDPSSGKVLGAQAVGKASGVEKRIDVISMAIQGGMSVYDLEEAELCYAPQFGSAKDPVNMAGFVAANSIRDGGVLHWEEVSQKLSDGSLAAVVDVRSEGEFSRGHFKGAANIAVNDVRTAIAKGEFDEFKGKPFAVYCQVGLRGYIADRILKQHGFQSQNITGGWLSYPTWISN